MEIKNGSQLAVQRLTALWALNECGLGGVLHALQVPFKGLFIGGFAVIIISLICVVSKDKKRSLIMAWMVVMSVKLILSPHTSPVAYIAVTFQAFTGLFLFALVSSPYLAAMLLSIIAMLQSAMQKIIVLSLLFGKSIWDAIDEWGIWVGEIMGFWIQTSSSLWLISIYTGIYFVGGIVIGHIAGRLTHTVFEDWEKTRFRLTLDKYHQLNITFNRRKNRYRSLLILSILLLLIIITLLIRTEGDAAWFDALKVVSRVVAIVFIWFAWVAPFIARFFHKYFVRKSGEYSQEISQTMELLPYIAWIIKRAWKDSGSHGWVQKIPFFFRLVIMYVLLFKMEEE
ncbi:MAG TPA: hypothetical protein PKC30_10900 [Saprospiraceae bacterium]|nr:hypothetical protein [Saprospiraceae bacterium]